MCSVRDNTYFGPYSSHYPLWAPKSVNNTYWGRKVHRCYALWPIWSPKVRQEPFKLCLRACGRTFASPIWLCRVLYGGFSQHGYTMTIIAIISIIAVIFVINIFYEYSKGPQRCTTSNRLRGTVNGTVGESKLLVSPLAIPKILH